MIKRRNITKDISDEIIASTMSEESRFQPAKPISLDKVVSTGSTLLDLSISGGRRRGGGIPGGIIVEIFGPAGSGKTSIMSEICTSAQNNRGEACILDPEGRIDREYSLIYGLKLNYNNYFRYHLVSEMFDYIRKWSPANPEEINVIGTDSLAALSTELEMDKGDKMGMRRAKEFSEGLRKTSVQIANNNWLIVCTNQVRDSEYGEVTPGGQAVPFYSSLRIRAKQVRPIIRKATVNFSDEEQKDGKGKRVYEAEKVIGIETNCYIKKSTVDDPYRECSIFITFGYGLDDVRGNLQYVKDVTKATTYPCPDGKSFMGMEQAIRHIETQRLEKELSEQVIDLWEAIEKAFKTERRIKQR
jgi:RecA/RadA recombinase